MKGKLISMILLTILATSCFTTSFDRENFTHYYWNRFNNNYSIKTNGFYVMEKEQIPGYVYVLIPFRNGTMYGFGNYMLDPDSLCQSYLKRNKNREHMYGVRYSWGAFSLTHDSISIQRLEILNSGSYMGGMYKVVEKRGMVLNDTTFLLTRYEGTGTGVTVIHEKFRFVSCMPKPDSTNWMMEDRKLNNLLEEYGKRN